MVKYHLCLLVAEHVRSKYVVIVVYPQLVLMMMSVKMTVDDTHGDAVHLPSDADTALVTPVASEAYPRVLGLKTSDVRDMSAEAVEAQHDTLQTNCPDLHVAQGRETLPETQGPWILPRQ